MPEIYDDFPCFDTIKELILDGAKRGADKRQFLYKDGDGELVEKTFSDVFDDVCSLGALMRSMGIDNTKKIAILSKNCYQWNVVFYAGAVNGSVLVPLDTGLSKEEVKRQIYNCSCDYIFYSESEERKISFLRKFSDVPIKHFFAMSEVENLCREGKKVPKRHLNAFLNQETKPEDLATIVYTSGTTDKTKGVMLSNKNICSDVNASLHAVTGSHGIGFLPLNHTYSWVTGLFATYCRTEWGYICTDVKRIYNDIKEFKPCQFAAVPLVVEMIYKNIISRAKRNGTYDDLMKGIETSRNFLLSGYDARREMFSEIHESLGGNLEYILCGGAYLQSEIEQFMFDIGIQIITGYGLTECSPCVTCSRQYDYKTGSVGLVLECNDVRINDPDEDGIGEIYVRGDNVMMGYYNDPEETAKAFDGEWLKSGDYGYFDSEGFLYFTGRKKNLIILSNGKNVSPEEVESEIYSSIEYVKECLVYEENGRMTAEFFLDEEKFPGCRDTLRGDVDRVNRKIADYKQIVRIKIRDEEFEKTTTLKIKRKYKKN